MDLDPPFCPASNLRREHLVPHSLSPRSPMTLWAGCTVIQAALINDDTGDQAGCHRRTIFFWVNVFDSLLYALGVSLRHHHRVQFGSN